MQIVLLSTGSPEFDRFPNGGGIQHQIYHTAQALSQLGHEPIVITRDPNAELPYGGTVESIEVPLSDEIMSRILFGKRATKIIDGYHPAAVLMYERFSALFPSRLGYPSLFITQNYDAMEFYRPFAIKRHALNRILFPVKKQIEEYVMRNSDRIIALNEDLKTYLHSRNIRHTLVIPNGVDPSKYESQEDGGFVLFAGRLNEVKGCGVLVEAFGELASDFPNIDLIIAGDGEERRFLEEAVDSKGLTQRVTFTGWLDQDDLRNYYGQCSVFALPSLFETFGIVVIEAMASEKPVVASDITGPGNIITHREDGMLVDSNNSSALADSIRDILRDDQLRSNIARSARKTVKTQYSFSVIAQDLIDVIGVLDHD